MTGLKRMLGAITRKVLELSARIPLGFHECVICGHSIARFLPYRGGGAGGGALMHALNIVGSDVNNFSCPWCYSHDRERHLYLYMLMAGIFSFLTGKRVLHFAPEMHLSRIIEKAGPDLFVKCDLHPWAPDMIKVDLLELPYADSYFDLLIANHVLEHVTDDRRAVAEIARVLKPGGFAILQTPYSDILLRTWEDAGINSKALRLEFFGQEDHLRLFGKDIFDRIEKQGLQSKVLSHDELLGDYCTRRFGLNEREPFFLFEKPLDRCDIASLKR